MFGGLLCPKENVNQFKKDLDTAINEAVKLDVAENSPESIISRQYFNYESQLTGDTKTAYSSLDTYRELFPKLFSDAIIKVEFSKAFNLAIKNDWF